MSSKGKAQPAAKAPAPAAKSTGFDPKAFAKNGVT